MPNTYASRFYRCLIHMHAYWCFQSKCSNMSAEGLHFSAFHSHTAYSINVLSKFGSLISHRPSIFEGRHIDHRSSKVDTSITDLRRSTRRSSISKGRHIDLRRSTHRDIDRRSSKGATSIFESRHIDLRKSPHRFLKIEGRNITPIIRHRILSTTALQVLRVDEVTHAYTFIIYTIIKINNI